MEETRNVFLDGNRLEVLNSYVYLGFKFTTSMSMHKSAKHLARFRVFRQRLLDISSQDWEAGLNASSRYDLYRDFKTMPNPEHYT